MNKTQIAIAIFCLLPRKKKNAKIKKYTLMYFIILIHNVQQKRMPKIRTCLERMFSSDMI